MRMARVHDARRAPRAVALLLAALATVPVPARPAPMPDGDASLTLRHLVDAARRQKASELALSASRLARASGMDAEPDLPSAERGRGPAGGPRDRDETPRLWALSVVDGRWRAELVIAGRVRRIDGLSGTPAPAGRWLVLAPTPDGLLLERLPSSTDRSAGPGGSRRLVVTLPGRGGTAAARGIDPPTPPGAPPSPSPAPVPDFAASDPEAADAPPLPAPAGSSPAPAP